MTLAYSGGIRGGSGGSLEPPLLNQTISLSRGNLLKSGKMLKTNPLVMDLNPLPEIIDSPCGIDKRTVIKLFKL